jgi:hypothetical protein
MSGGAQVTVRFGLQWDLWLDAQNEQQPFAHFFLSTLYAREVQQVELETAKGSMNLSLVFRDERLAKIDPEDLVCGCDLNIDFFVRTKNAYDEDVQNPAGSLVIPLHEIIKNLDGSRGPAPVLEKRIGLFMIHNTARNTKGNLKLLPVAIRAGGGGANRSYVAAVSLRDIDITTKHYNGRRVQQSIDRVSKIQNMMARYIEMTEGLYGGVQPSIQQVSRINSAIWVSRAGVFPPIAYVVDIVPPGVTEAFYRNSLDVVLRRNRITLERLRSLNVRGDRVNKEHVLLMSNLVGQMMCSYVVHCVYRSDFVYVKDKNTGEFIKQPVENFGDVTVDRGAGGMLC